VKTVRKARSALTIHDFGRFDLAQAPRAGGFFVRRLPKKFASDHLAIIFACESAPSRKGMRREHQRTKIMKLFKTLMGMALLGTTFSLHADDLEFDDCPATVQETIRANARGGEVDDVNLLLVEGLSLYYVKIDLPGERDLKMLVGTDGKLIKTQEQLTVADTPEVVRQAVSKLVPEGTLDDIDKEVADGKTTYLVEIDRPKREDLNLVFAEDGTLLSQSEQD
jgi:uncharacterized membrane protein YkoI